MSQYLLYGGESRGPIAYMVSNRIAPNLLMFGIIILGIISLGGLKREAWPKISFNMIEVFVAYPGASPEEVEKSVILKIEEQIETLDDVKSIRSQAAPGAASVRVQLKDRTDINEAMDEIRAGVERISSFPAGAERPLFREMDNRNSVIRLVLYGDITERSLKELAGQVKRELKTLSGISLVEVNGTRDYEISIEVPLATLRAFGLTLGDIANVIRQSSLNLSAGSIDTKDSEVRVRTVGQNYNQFDFEELVVVAQGDGTIVRLSDIATIHDGFEDSNIIVRHQGMPAAFVEVYRGDGEDVKDISDVIGAYLEETLIPSLPNGVEISIWNDDSPAYSERAELLIRNGFLGFILVFIALALFLEIRLAIWVIFGLITSGMGALVVMLWYDLALNTNSLFAFLLAIGIIVDDAIVVAEQIYTRRMSGLPGPVAAIRGARRIKAALTFAVLTSVAAFTPLFFIPGGIGEVWFALPTIIIAMLIISLVEALFILPSHLAHLPGPEWKPSNIADRFLFRTRTMVDQWMTRFVKGPLDRSLRFATDYPAIIMCGTVGLFIFCLSLVPAGVIPTTLAEVIEGDFVTVTLEMPEETLAERTFEVAQELEAAGLRVIERLDQQRPEGAPSLLRGVILVVGQGPRLEGGGLNPAPTMNPPANIASIEFKLLNAQERDISTTTVVQLWREEVGFLPYVRGLTFSGNVINLGNPVEVVLSHSDPERLTAAVDSVVNDLYTVTGVFDIRSDHAPGVREVQLELQPAARTLGVTLEDLAQQVRSAFFGVEAVRLQREEDEVRVYTRLPANERESITDIEGYLIQNQPNSKIPINQVASIRMGTSQPVIRRKDGLRIATVTADVNTDVISGGQANEILENTFLDKLTRSDPELTYSFGGEQQEQLESVGALYRGFIFAMLAIFALLAIGLRSFRKPFLLLAIVPFGLIGVLLGHVILGIPISVASASVLGFFGLSGVVINDALVMMDSIDRRIQNGHPPREAIIDGAKSRFRPIMLTSVTTFLAFTPLILEPAIQAQYLTPFAASLGIGIMITTAILIVLLPAMMAAFLRINSKHRASDSI